MILPIAIIVLLFANFNTIKVIIWLSLVLAIIYQNVLSRFYFLKYFMWVNAMFFKTWPSIAKICGVQADVTSSIENFPNGTQTIKYYLYWHMIENPMLKEYSIEIIRRIPMS